MMHYAGVTSLSFALLFILGSRLISARPALTPEFIASICPNPDTPISIPFDLSNDPKNLVNGTTVAKRQEGSSAPVQVIPVPGLSLVLEVTPCRGQPVAEDPAVDLLLDLAGQIKRVGGDLEHRIPWKAPAAKLAAYIEPDDSRPNPRAPIGYIAPYKAISELAEEFGTKEVPSTVLTFRVLISDTKASILDGALYKTN